MGERMDDGKQSIWLNDWMPVLGPICIGLAAMLLIFVIKVGALLYALVGAVDPNEANAVNAIRGVGWLFGAFVGGAVAVVFGTWRGLIAEKQTVVARDQYERSLDRDYADLFTKAVEQLGTDKVVRRQAKGADGALLFGKNKRPVMEETTEPNIEVRLGAIYALERISQDSERDHIAVMETLCAYVRENAPVEGSETFEAPVQEGGLEGWALGDWWRGIFKTALRAWIETLPAPRADIQAVLTVLGRRKAGRVVYEVGPNEKEPRYRLDLRRSTLCRADMRKGDFRNALFLNARMQGVDLWQARMQGADLSEARMQGAYLRQAQCQSAKLAMVRIDSVMASFADFTDAEDMTQEAVDCCFGCGGTILPTELERPVHWHPERLEDSFNQRKAYDAWKTARAAGERPS